VTLRKAIALPDGPKRTAAIAAWIQGLFKERTPVLVGGAAVELYTGGSYTTGDLDFVGQVPLEVARALENEGFKKEGRHWIHERFQIFVEFPGSTVEHGETTALLDVDGIKVLTLSPEDMIVDRLEAWQFWRSATDGVSAYLIWRAQLKRLDEKRLAAIAQKRGVEESLSALRKLVRGGSSISPEEVKRWASRKS
jgi:hypothetical protein